MEEFEQLSWRITDVSTLDIGTNFIKEENIEKSYIFLNNFTPYDFPIKEQQQQQQQQNKPKTTKYPIKSCLNKTQHLQCLKALQLLELGRPLAQYSQQEQQLINIFNNLKLEIIQENKAFLNYVENKWKTELYQRTKPPSKHKKILYFIQKHCEMKLELVKNYDKFYDQVDTISLACNDNIIEVNQEICPLELGTVARTIHPTINKYAHLNLNKILSIKSAQDSIIAEGEELTITKLPVSQDIYAEELAKRYNCDIVISSSGLKTIIDNYGPDYNSLWDLPVIVKEYVVDGTKKTISFVDKRLQQHNPDWRELSKKSFKTLLKTNFCATLQHRFETPEIIKSLYQLHKSTKNELNDDNKTEELIDDNEKDDLNKNPKPVQQKNYKVFHNVSYRIWRMKLIEEKQVLMKGCTENKELKILVRCKNDGCDVEENGLLRPVSIASKLEFQWEHGGEIITKSEILRQWTILFFRPFSSLLRMRVNTSNGNLLKIENMNINTIVNESCKHYKFNPASNLSVLFNVLFNINKLTVGNYILRHTLKHGAFAAVMKSQCDKGLLNFNELYKKENCSIEQSLKWNPIDTTLILPYHVENNIMPGIFPPACADNPQGGHPKIKGKKKKKTRKPKNPTK